MIFFNIATYRYIPYMTMVHYMFIDSCSPKQIIRALQNLQQNDTCDLLYTIDLNSLYSFPISSLLHVPVNMVEYYRRTATSHFGCISTISCRKLSMSNTCLFQPYEKIALSQKYFLVLHLMGSNSVVCLNIAKVIGYMMTNIQLEIRSILPRTNLQIHVNLVNAGIWLQVAI